MRREEFARKNLKEIINSGEVAKRKALNTWAWDGEEVCAALLCQMACCCNAPLVVVGLFSQSFPRVHSGNDTPTQINQNTQCSPYFSNYSQYLGNGRRILVEISRWHWRKERVQVNQLD